MLHRRISRTIYRKQGKTRLGFCNSLLNSFTGISGGTFSGAFSIETSANLTPVLRTSFFNLISSKILDLEIHTSRTETLLFSFQKPLQICPSINRLSKKQLSFALIRAVVVRYLDANGFFVAVNTTILQSAFRKTNSCSFRFCSSSVPSSFVMSSLFVYDESLHALNIVLTHDKRIPQNNPNSSK